MAKSNKSTGTDKKTSAGKVPAEKTSSKSKKKEEELDDEDGNYPDDEEDTSKKGKKGKAAADDDDDDDDDLDEADDDWEKIDDDESTATTGVHKRNSAQSLCMADEPEQFHPRDGDDTGYSGELIFESHSRWRQRFGSSQYSEF